MPLNVDKISTGSLVVNGIEITGSGLQTVAVDGVTIFGDGTLTNPLSASTIPSASYKVYTALLTQSGDSDSPYFIQGGTLDIGNTYMIYQDSLGMDFTNVGAPNNNLNTYFVATGTTPNSWGSNEYSTDILYSNNGWPTVNILENTIGTLAFLRQTDGYYSIVSQDNLFNINKTWYNITPGDLINNAFYQEMVYNTTSEILVYTSIDGTLADGVLNKIPIEIRVYN